jgi:hypothetical protein
MAARVFQAHGADAAVLVHKRHMRAWGGTGRRTHAPHASASGASCAQFRENLMRCGSRPPRAGSITSDLDCAGARRPILVIAWSQRAHVWALAPAGRRRHAALKDGTAFLFRFRRSPGEKSHETSLAHSTSTSGGLAGRRDPRLLRFRPSGACSCQATSSWNAATVPKWYHDECLPRGTPGRIRLRHAPGIWLRYYPPGTTLRGGACAEIWPDATSS